MRRERWTTTIDPRIKRRLFAAAGFREVDANELFEQILDQALPKVDEKSMAIVEPVPLAA